jgi:hypothetical protein
MNRGSASKGTSQLGCNINAREGWQAVTAVIEAVEARRLASPVARKESDARWSRHAPDDLARAPNG